MARLKQISTLVHLLIITLSAQAENPDAKKQSEIKSLEKQKDELFQQINEAIDDSVKALGETNDTDSKLGIALITDLKKQLEELNGTATISDQLENQNDTRRRGKKDSRKWLPFQRSQKDNQLFEDDLLMKSLYSQKHKDRLDNRVHMQMRVEEWLNKKAEEKLRLKHYYFNKTSNAAADKVNEKCPVYGVAKNGKRDKRGKKMRDKKFGCCRKCCKKSYMGCLKKK
ncbi:hypothetical protein O0L34_g18938 [Tuta absoluta]|nr:hypothetical protein O0L34_g18938 [Tuta absoluta]